MAPYKKNCPGTSFRALVTALESFGASRGRVCFDTVILNIFSFIFQYKNYQNFVVMYIHLLIISF